jgi:Ca2+-transporting ATPase
MPLSDNSPIAEIAIQVLIVFVGNAAFQVTPIGGREWGISLALGAVSIPLGALIRLMPNPPFERLFKAMRLLGNASVLPTISPDRESSWNPVVDRVRDTLSTFMQVRGGRLRSSHVVKSRNARLSEEKVAPDSPPV